MQSRSASRRPTHQHRACHINRRARLGVKSTAWSAPRRTTHRSTPGPRLDGWRRPRVAEPECRSATSEALPTRSGSRVELVDHSPYLGGQTVRIPAKASNPRRRSGCRSAGPLRRLQTLIAGQNSPASRSSSPTLRVRARPPSYCLATSELRLRASRAQTAASSSPGIPSSCSTCPEGVGRQVGWSVLTFAP